MPGKRDKRIYVTSPFHSIFNLEQWDAMTDWLIAQQVQFRRAIKAVGGLETVAHQ